MRRRTLVTAVAALFLLASCAGSDSTSDTTAAPSTVAPTDSTAEQLTPDMIASATDFCALQSGMDALNSPFDNAASTPADFEAWFTGTVRPAIAKLQEIAPAEIADDVKVLVEGLTRFADKFEQHGYDVGVAYQDPEMQQIAQNESYNAAGDAVDAFCGT
ncbi:MAG: hypothetical protein RI900_1294 [Actinomycetota bacterium]|jgi:hypothetical protein